MPQPIRGQGGHLGLPIGPKNTNLVEDVEIVIHVKFRCIPFSGCRVEVLNVLVNQRPGRPSCVSCMPVIPSCVGEPCPAQPKQVVILFFRSTKKKPKTKQNKKKTQTW